MLSNRVISSESLCLRCRRPFCSLIGLCNFLTRVIRFCIGSSPARVSPGRVRRGKNSCWPQFQCKRALNLRSEAAFGPAAQTSSSVRHRPLFNYSVFLQAHNLLICFWSVYLRQTTRLVEVGLRSLFMTGQWPKEAGGLTVRRARACFCASYWQSSDADD